MELVEELIARGVPKVEAFKEVSKERGIPWSTLATWYYGKSRPVFKKELKPSPELAYLIGVYLSDGNVYFDGKGHYDFRLKVKDLDFAQETKRCLEAIGLGASVLKWNDFFWLRCTSKGLYKLLRSIAEKGTKGDAGIREIYWEKLEEYVEVDEETIRSFLRGLFDGDGSSNRLFNTHLPLLLYAKDLLGRLGVRTGKVRLVSRKGTVNFIEGRLIAKKKNCYSLRVNKKDFLAKVGFSIRRKAA